MWFQLEKASNYHLYSSLPPSQKLVKNTGFDFVTLSVQGNYSI